MGIRRRNHFQTCRHLADKKEDTIGLVHLTDKWAPGPLCVRDVVALEWRTKHASILVVGV
eukprot:6841900-Pyramimonas_sp.AAC.1